VPPLDRETNSRSITNYPLHEDYQAPMDQNKMKKLINNQVRLIIPLKQQPTVENKKDFEKTFSL